MSNGTFGFKTQLRGGELGEIIFLEARQDLVKLENFKSDFRCKETGAQYELKTDYYDMTKTPNLFIERWSDRDRQAPGGPYQAQAHGSEYFVYFFIKNLTYYTFKTAALIERLDKLIPELSPREIRNNSWTTVGYLVPRSELSDLYTETTLTVSVTNHE